jgi:hypothetical protein
VTCACRVFLELVHADSDVMHVSHEKLYEGAIFRRSEEPACVAGSF